jgi:hypothetical protein
VNKYWKFLTSDLSQEEIADLEKAKGSLEKYEQIYTIFEYGADLNLIMTCLDARVAANNPSIPFTVYRQVISYFSNDSSPHTTHQRRSSTRWS